MFRKIPVANKLVSNRINEKNSEIHEQKLRTITSKVDSQASGSYSACLASHNKNRSYFQESKNSEIERENRLLLEKITKIKKQNFSNSSSIYKTIQTEEAQGSTTTTTTTDTIQSCYQPKIRACSSGRKKILLGIMDENRKMLERIKASKSEFNHQKLEKEYKRKEELLLQISEFPLALPRRLPSRSTSTQNNNNNSISQNNSINIANNSSFMSNTRNTIEPSSISPVSHNKQKKTLGPVQNGTLIRADSDWQNQPDQQSFIRSYVGRKTMLFDGTICHGDKTYSVKVFVEKGVFKIVADQAQSELTQVLEMAESDGMKVIKQVYSNSVLALVQNITITDKIRLHALDAHINQNAVNTQDNNINASNSSNNKNSSFLPQIEQIVS